MAAFITPTDSTTATTVMPCAPTRTILITQTTDYEAGNLPRLSQEEDEWEQQKEFERRFRNNRKNWGKRGRR
jgi:hypothetical protein